MKYTSQEFEIQAMGPHVPNVFKPSNHKKKFFLTLILNIFKGTNVEFFIQSINQCLFILPNITNVTFVSVDFTVYYAYSL